MLSGCVCKVVPEVGRLTCLGFFFLSYKLPEIGADRKELTC